MGPCLWVKAAAAEASVLLSCSK